MTLDGKSISPMEHIALGNMSLETAFPISLEIRNKLSGASTQTLLTHCCCLQVCRSVID